MCMCVCMYVCMCVCVCLCLCCLQMYSSLLSSILFFFSLSVGKEILGFAMRIGWSKPIPIPPFPLTLEGLVVGFFFFFFFSPNALFIEVLSFVLVCLIDSIYVCFFFCLGMFVGFDDLVKKKKKKKKKKKQVGPRAKMTPQGWSMPGVHAIAAARETQVVVLCPSEDERVIVDKLASHLASEGPEMEVCLSLSLSLSLSLFCNCFLSQFSSVVLETHTQNTNALYNFDFFFVYLQVCVCVRVCFLSDGDFSCWSFLSSSSSASSVFCFCLSMYE